MKISFRTAVVIAIVVGVVGSLLFPVTANAQDIITQTNTNAMMFQAAANAADSSSSKARYQQTQAPAPKLYRERVPGKPEEGFVPVTAPTARKNYQYTKVDYPYGEVLIFEDFVRRNVCYITMYYSRIAESCVPMK